MLWHFRFAAQDSVWLKSFGLSGAKATEEARLGFRAWGDKGFGFKVELFV